MPLSSFLPITAEILNSADSYKIFPLDTEFAIRENPKWDKFASLN